MGDWTGTVPSMAAGSKDRASEDQTLADIATALTAAWTTWVPSLTNLTVGTTPLVAKYRRVGKTVDWKLRFAFSAGAAVGTTPTFSLPATPASDYVVSGEFLFPGTVWLLDSGTRFQQGALRHDSSGVVTLVPWTAINSTGGIDATTPWTWATGDSINAYGTYETA